MPWGRLRKTLRGAGGRRRSFTPSSTSVVGCAPPGRGAGAASWVRTPLSGESVMLPPLPMTPNLPARIAAVTTGASDAMTIGAASSRVGARVAGFARLS